MPRRTLGLTACHYTAFGSRPCSSSWISDLQNAFGEPVHTRRCRSAGGRAYTSVSCSLLPLSRHGTQALLTTDPSTELYKTQFRLLRRQCRTSGLVPTSCRITRGIDRSGSEPVSRSSMSDIYRGTLNGVEVAIKVLRLHMNDVQHAQKVRRTR
jgi:hypothetical protein